MEESALTDVSFDQLLPMYVDVCELKILYLQQCMNITKVRYMQGTFGVQKVQPSKVESYLEVNA